jgi:hypothetical protein
MMCASKESSHTLAESAAGSQQLKHSVCVGVLVCVLFQRCVVCFVEGGQMCIWEEAENFSLYSEDERNELLFHLFSQFVIGGGMNQSGTSGVLT